MQTPPTGQTSEIPAIPEPKATSARPAVAADLYLHKLPADLPGKSGMADLRMRVPAATALPQALALARSLRPLKKRVPSRTHRVLDIERTIYRIAEANARFWTLVEHPALIRRFDLAVVVDRSHSMLLWKQTISELLTLLESEGAFREISLWNLATDQGEEVILSMGTAGAESQRQIHHPRELADFTGRRLILVLTDCLAPAWQSGKVPNLLNVWGQKNPVTIMQMLPRRLWPRTALRTATFEFVSSPYAGAANRYLQRSGPADDTLSQSVPLPVVTLEFHALATWAQMLMSMQGQIVPGAIFPLIPPSDDPAIPPVSQASASLSAQESIQLFRMTASSLANRLAGLLAAANQVSLPLIRLIQSTMLPKASQVHIAEIFLSGLLIEKREENPEGQSDPEYKLYQFLPGVAEALLDAVPMPESFRVLDVITAYIEQHYGQAREFNAWLAAPTLNGELPPISAATRPFARAAVNLWRRFGGEYARLAERLEQHIQQSPAPDIPVQLNSENLSRQPDFIRQADVSLATPQPGDEPEQISSDFIASEVPTNRARTDEWAANRTEAGPVSTIEPIEELKEDVPVTKDFFISYHPADERMAVWIAQELEAAGYTAFVQGRDIPIGESIVLYLDAALRNMKQFIALLSEDYLHDRDAEYEWSAAIYQDLVGNKRIFLPIRVRPCVPLGLLAAFAYIDFVGVDVNVARQRLLAGLTKRPTNPPPIPLEAMPAPASQKDFYISCDAADADWALWIADQLDRAGYTTIVQAMDPLPGSNFIRKIHEAIINSRQTIAVLSENYIKNELTTLAWKVSSMKDAPGARRTFIPVRVHPFDLRGVFATIICIDLIDIDEEEACRRLLAGVAPGREQKLPRFPGRVRGHAESTSEKASIKFALSSKMTTPIKAPIEIFVVYEQHDQTFLDLLEKQLSSLERYSPANR